MIGIRPVITYMRICRNFRFQGLPAAAADGGCVRWTVSGRIQFGFHRRS